MFVRLVKYALKALDIYTITVNTSGQTCVRPAAVATVKTKEEKEVLEHFAGVVSQALVFFLFFLTMQQDN